MRANKSFYKFSFWLKDILTDGKAYVYIKADSEDEAIEKFNYKYGHYAMSFIEMKAVRRNSHAYNLLCSIYKEVK